MSFCHVITGFTIKYFNAKNLINDEGCNVLVINFDCDKQIQTYKNKIEN